MNDATTSDLNGASLDELVTLASQEPVLDEKAEATLARRLSEGETEARQRLLMGNLRMAVDEAIRHRGLGAPQSQLVRRAVRTLATAARDYDPELHGLFSRYAGRLVRSALSEEVTES
ncbi:MAG: hypothetical protein U5R14_06375 [Gemmatimonadota bacterium]|nr:hypothetical protein [Gemmatimonadota bacterium]